MAARQGKRLYVTDEKREQWRANRARLGLTARAIAEGIKELEPDNPRPSLQTVRGILAGRTPSTTLYESMDRLLGGEVSPEDMSAKSTAVATSAIEPTSGAGRYEGTVVAAFRRAVSLGASPRDVAAAAIEAIAVSTERQLVGSIRSLIPPERGK